MIVGPDLLQTLLWRFNDAVRLRSLVEQKQVWYDVNQKTFWESWVRDVFDLRTANDFGCAVWSVILDMPSLASQPAKDARVSFGFGAYRTNFNRGNFSNAVGTKLTLAEKRLLLRLKYLKLVSNGTLTINETLQQVFSDFGPAYLIDMGGMACRYDFGFALSAPLAEAIDIYDVLPRPAGVYVSWRQTLKTFGFGVYHLNFNRGAFA